jgi:hypothetical protein
MDKQRGSPRTNRALATTKPDQRVEGDNVFDEMMAQAFELEIGDPVSAVAAPSKGTVKPARRPSQRKPGP